MSYKERSLIMKKHRRSVAVFSAFLVMLFSLTGFHATAQTAVERHGIVRWTPDGVITSEYVYNPMMRKNSTLFKPASLPAAALEEQTAEPLPAANRPDTLVDAHEYIHCAAGQITADFDTNQDGVYDFTSLGSGYLEAEDIVLTAAHVIYNTEYDVWGYNIQFHPAQHGSGDQYDTAGNYKPANVINMAISQEYVDLPDWEPDQDWAILTVDKNLGDQYGTFGLSGEPYVNQNLTLAGYPETGAGYQYTSTGRVTAVVNDLYFEHTNYSERGYSGGPVYDANGTAFGIFTTIRGGGASAQSGSTRFAAWLFDMIIQACNESAARW